MRVFFLTLTSAPGSPVVLLRENWKRLRRMLAHRLGLDHSEVSYVCVETSEGCGVLHILLAVPPGGSERFLVSVEWLREHWERLHGARQLNIKPVRDSHGDRVRVSRYMVNQYVAGQSLLRRLSSSRDVMRGDLRRRWVSLVVGHPGVYVAACGDGDRVAKLRWETVRKGWRSILRGGCADVFGEMVALWCGEFVTV